MGAREGLVRAARSPGAEPQHAGVSIPSTPGPSRGPRNELIGVKSPRPKRAELLKLVDVDEMRHLDCLRAGECLKIAIASNWRAFRCGKGCYVAPAPALAVRRSE